MQPYAPPRRRSSAGAIIGTILVVGFLFLGLVVAAAIGFLVMMKSETQHARVIVERERAMNQMEHARARVDAQRMRVPQPQPTPPPMRSAPSTGLYPPVLETPATLAEKKPIRVANRDITLELDQDGKITMDGKPIESDQLTSALGDAGKGRESAVSVLIKADKKCLFEHVASVLTVCQELDIPNVRIAAQE